MDAFRRWVRVLIIVGLVLSPVMAMLEGGVEMGKAAAIETVFVVICAAGAVYSHRAAQGDAGVAESALDATEPWET